MKSPFPYYGGKSKIAGMVWQKFGNVPNFIEPFAGSLAVLLARPSEPKIETVNDKNCYLANFWRALQHNPEQVAHYADSPVNEADLHAKHLWLVNRADFRERMMTDPDYYDCRVAGWWVWGASCWIGSGWCEYEKSLARQRSQLTSDNGVVAVTKGRQVRHLTTGGQGVNRQLPHVGNGSLGVHRVNQPLQEYLQALADRLRHVRVCCGDWTRVCTPAVTVGNGLTGVLFDPPYSAEADRDTTLYASEDLSVAHDVRRWCLENGDNPQLRLALCGYAGEHDELEDCGWNAWAWKANGGYGNQSEGRGKTNSKREVVWFSPHCLGVTLFDMEPAL